MTSPKEQALVKAPANVLAQHLSARLVSLKDVLPAGTTPERIARIALGATHRNPKLLECTPASFVDAVLQGAELGLEVGGVLGEAWLVPFFEKGSLKAKMIIGYQGLLKLAYQHPRVLAVKSILVREGDHFLHTEGSKPSCEHTPITGSQASVTNAYCRWQLQGGVSEVDVMSREELDVVKMRSLDKLADWMIKTSPWTLHEGEMQKKTVLRRSIKYAPRSTMLDRAIELVAREDEE